MTIAIAILLLFLLALLALVSYVDRIYTEMGKFLSREFQENIEAFELRVEPKLGPFRERAPLSMAVLSQLLTASIAMTVMYLVMANGKWTGAEIAQSGLALVMVVLIFNRLLPFIFFTRTKGDWLEPFTLLLKILIVAAMPVTLVLSFCLQIAALAERHEPVVAESQSEAVDALIEAGQEEGILEESDRELIQSVVEFRDKVVREVMTPRPEVIAIPISATIEEFTELLRTKPYSRVPAFDGNIDHIKGLVFAHDVLQVTDTDARTRTVASLMKPIHFVPESKPIQEMMREMQKQKIHLAVVIDEYGSVAGVVTIEDLVEELVGEIRDEHEAQIDITKESEHSYIVPGSMDIDRLAELFGVRPEDREATTVAGLVSEIVGRIPHPGEVIEDSGLRYEILQSTDRKVERMRICTQESQDNPSDSGEDSGRSRLRA